MGQIALLESSQSITKRAVLDRLRRGPATNIELNTICFRYGARIFELRHHDGYDITRSPMKAGVCTYTLRGHQ